MGRVSQVQMWKPDRIVVIRSRPFKFIKRKFKNSKRVALLWPLLQAHIGIGRGNHTIWISFLYYEVIFHETLIKAVSKLTSTLVNLSFHSVCTVPFFKHNFFLVYLNRSLLFIIGNRWIVSSETLFGFDGDFKVETESFDELIFGSHSPVPWDSSMICHSIVSGHNWSFSLMSFSAAFSPWHWKHFTTFKHIYFCKIYSFGAGALVWWLWEETQIRKLWVRIPALYTFIAHLFGAKL